MAAPRGSLWVGVHLGLPPLLLLTLALAGGSGTASAEAFDSVLGDTASCHRVCQMTYPLHTYPKVGPCEPGDRAPVSSRGPRAAGCTLLPRAPPVWLGPVCSFCVPLPQPCVGNTKRRHIGPLLPGSLRGCQGPVRGARLPGE